VVFNANNRLNFQAVDRFTITGGSGADHLRGAAGDDVLDGGLGADTLDGNDGNDTLKITGGTTSANTPGETANGGNGTDHLILDYSKLTQQLGIYVNDATNGNGFADIPDGTRKLTFTGVERMTVTGGSAADAITGLNGDDVLDGGGGDDLLTGGAGNDVYLVEGNNDTVVEAANGGTDEIRTAAGGTTGYSDLFALAQHVEIFTGTNAAGQGVVDSSTDTTFNMADGNDVVIAHIGGTDIIHGNGGDDFIYFGDKWSSGDQAHGGAGYDNLAFLGNVTIVFEDGALSGIEQISVYRDNEYYGTPSHYSLAMHDSSVAAGQSLLVTAASLTAPETLTFNGSAELDGSFAVLGGAGMDQVTGGGGKDYIDGNDGNDTLDGGGGNDRLVGGTGSDRLTGGAGKDFFLYESVADSNTTGGVDVITDFQGTAVGERIDLTGIDANDKVAGNQAFTFIGVGTAFSAAGQLRVVQTGNNWFVEGDIDGDGTADLTIQIDGGGNIPWAASDFLL
jgi:Ca2+-binding RTX toxin-like protein